MPKSRDELIKASLEEVLRLGAGQLVEGEDAAAVSGLIQPLLDDLRDSRVVTIDDADAIPEGYFVDLVRLLGQAIVTKFGGARDRGIEDAARDSLSFKARHVREVSPLVLAVLEQAGVMGVGAVAIDATMVTGRIGPLLANLAARNIIYIADREAIEDSDHPAFNDVACWIVTQIAPLQAGALAGLYEEKLSVLQRIGKGRRRTLRLDTALVGRRGYLG